MDASDNEKQEVGKLCTAYFTTRLLGSTAIFPVNYRRPLLDFYGKHEDNSWNGGDSTYELELPPIPFFQFLKQVESKEKMATESWVEFLYGGNKGRCGSDWLKGL